MVTTNSSLLLISADAQMSSTVKAALAKIANLKVTTQETSIAQLNGAAFKLAKDHDIVVFATDPSNAADLLAIEALTEQRRDKSVFLALTDSDLPLSRARELSRAGVDDVLPYPIADEDFAELVAKWAKKLAKLRATSGQGDHEGVVIAVAQARGGIGSTTVAVNLADQLLGKKGRFRKDAAHRVAILDLDMQFGTVGDFLDVEPQEGLMKLATDGITPDAMWMQQSLIKTESGLSVLTAPTSFVPLDMIRNDQVAAMIDVLRKSHDYVVIDLPRALVTWIEPIISTADQLIVVTDTTVPSIRASRRLIDFFTTDNPGLNIEVVINHEKKPFMAAHHQKEAAKALDRKFNHWLPHDAKAARDAVDFGKPLSEVAPRSELSKAIAGLAKATIASMPATQHVTG